MVSSPLLPYLVNYDCLMQQLMYPLRGFRQEKSTMVVKDRLLFSLYTARDCEDDRVINIQGRPAVAHAVIGVGFSGSVGLSALVGSIGNARAEAPSEIQQQASALRTEEPQVFPNFP